MSNTTNRTLYDVLKEKKILTKPQAIYDFINGKRLVVLNNSGSHNYGAIGTVFTVTLNPQYLSQLGPTNGSYLITTGHNSISWSSLKISATTISEIEIDIEEINECIENLQREKKENQTKIKFMKANNLKEFDETEFKVYAVLEVLEGNSSKVDMAKAISALIKG